jgi:hypothetical protein
MFPLLLDVVSFGNCVAADETLDAGGAVAPCTSVSVLLLVVVEVID